MASKWYAGFAAAFRTMKLIIVSVHDQSSVSRSVLEAGANGFVVKRAIATDLLAATDAVLAGQRYVSPEVAGYRTNAAVTRLRACGRRRNF